MRLILKFLETRLQLDVINAKLGYKGPKFVHYEPTLIEKSVSNIPVIIIMVLIFPDFNIFTVVQMYMIYKLESFWPDFGMMTSQHGARILRFPENSFINEYLTSKFFLLLIFIFLSPFVQEIPVWILFRVNFVLMTSQHWVKTSKFWENGFIKE